MTKKQREDFDATLKELDRCEEDRSDRSARAGYVADALRILSARLDEIEVMAKRALIRSGAY